MVDGQWLLITSSLLSSLSSVQNLEGDTQKVTKETKGEGYLVSDNPILLANHAEGVVNLAIFPATP